MIFIDTQTLYSYNYTSVVHSLVNVAYVLLEVLVEPNEDSRVGRKIFACGQVGGYQIDQARKWTSVCTVGVQV